MLAIQQLLRSKPLERPQIDEFLASHAFPLVEGPEATFVFHGRADQVNLRHFIYGLPSVQPLHRADGSDLWYLTLEIPERSRIEYKIERVVGDRHEWLRDPLNPLGTRALYLSWQYYRIHGTQDTRKIGRRSSSGCIGLYNEHIEEIYARAPVGTQVKLI